VNTAGVQPGLWSTVSDTANPVAPAQASEPRASNPFAASGPAGPRRSGSISGRKTAHRNWWRGFRAWLGWPEASATRRRLFPTNDQLELVLGRSRPLPQKRNLEIGSSARVRRSSVSADKSKVIYESKPAVAVEAARMMVESDRAYTRLRGRRLESLRVAND
jgi:hypothetical protein